MPPPQSLSHDGWELYYREQHGAKAWNGVPDAFLVEHLAEIIPAAPAKVIDVACGDGRNTVPFLSKGLALVCVDLSPSALVSFADQCQVEGVVPPLLISGDFLDLDILAEQFQCAVCFNAISHFTSPALAIDRMVSLLTKGGRAAFNVFTTHDVAFGEGEEIGKNRFAYKDTLFTFMDWDDVQAILPQNVKVLRSEVRRWREPAHGCFRLAPHTHEALYFLIERS